MALPVATPENLNTFAEQLRDNLAGSGSALRIEAKIRDMYEGEDHSSLRRFYIGVPVGFNLEGVSLRMFRKGKCKWRAAAIATDDGNLTPYTRGYIEPKTIDMSSPLFSPILKDGDPAFTERGLEFREVTMGDYDSMQEYATEEALSDSGYIGGEGNVSIQFHTILANHHWYLSLFKDDKRISNYVRMCVVYNGDSENPIACITQ